jgi:hypothetical protein
MEKAVSYFCRVVLSLIMLLPIVGPLDLMPAPTRDLYNTDRAFQFIQVLMEARYITVMMAVVFALALYLLWTKRAALAALLILPVTLNIMGFHAFLDGGLFTGGAVLGNGIFLLNLYFLWQGRGELKQLLNRSA